MFASIALRSARRPARLLRLHLRRLLVVPRVAAVQAVEAVGPAPARVSVRVDGMVCTACAARTGAAFRRVHGVRDVAVDLDAGIAELTVDAGRALSARDLQRALDGVVIARPARRLLARTAAAVTPRVRGVR